MCRSMVDIQSVAAEIRRGKKKDRMKAQGKNIMYASATQGSHNKHTQNEFCLKSAHYSRLGQVHYGLPRETVNVGFCLSSLLGN